MLKAILIDCIPPSINKKEAEFRLQEAESLIKTYGGVVLIKKIQKKLTPHYSTYIGSGKIDEIIAENKELQANIVIINNELKPQQTYNLGEKFRPHNLQVWDRIDLILKIFQKHATTNEAKLEIELASIRHMGPRIYGMGMQLTRQGGGIGTKGAGETNLETMHRHLDKAEHRIKQELERYRQVRTLHRNARKRKEFKTAGIIGYTNAGKTSLLNALTHKGAYTADKLFATLDTRIGKMELRSEAQEAPAPSGHSNQAGAPYHEEILISDTIGFIQDLPTTLIKSFQSTLEETIQADLLLHVIDINDPKILDKIKVVNLILAQIDALHKPTLYVFNKIDLLPKSSKNPSKLKKAAQQKIDKLQEQFQKFQPTFISTYSLEGILELKATIQKALSQ